MNLIKQMLIEHDIQFWIAKGEDLRKIKRKQESLPTKRRIFNKTVSNTNGGKNCLTTALQ